MLCALVTHRSASQCRDTKSSSSSLYGVSCCHLPHFPHLPKPLWPIFFVQKIVNRSHHFPQELFHSKTLPITCLGKTSARPAPSSVYLCFALRHLPSNVAIPAKVNLYHAARNQFERFRGFLELISRFEFEFLSLRKLCFWNDSNFCCVQSLITDHVAVHVPVL